MSRRRRYCRCGFTLIEVVVSIAILALGVVGLMGARARALNAVAAARDTMACARLCAGQAAAVRAGIVAAGKGEFEDGYAWEVAEVEVGGPVGPELKGYYVTVSPPGGRDEGRTSLTVWVALCTAEDEHE